jgi:hypothetical protein
LEHCNIHDDKNTKFSIVHICKKTNKSSATMFTLQLFVQMNLKSLCKQTPTILISNQSPTTFQENPTSFQLMIIFCEQIPTILISKQIQIPSTNKTQLF